MYTGFLILHGVLTKEYICVCVLRFVIIINFYKFCPYGGGASYVIDNIGRWGCWCCLQKGETKKMLIIYAKYTYTLRSESDLLMYSLSIKFSIRFLMMAGLG